MNTEHTFFFVTDIDRTRKNLTVVIADVREIVKIQDAFRGADCVIHSASYVSIGHFPDAAGMKDVNENGNSNLKVMLERFKRTKTIIICTVDGTNIIQNALLSNTSGAVTPKPISHELCHAA